MIRTNKYFGVVIGLLVTVLLCSFNIDDASASTYSLSMTSSGAQVLNVVTTGDGISISADAINVTTTCRYGYNFVISTSVNNNNLYLNGDANNNTVGTYFTPVDGTSTLNNSTNAWGYYYNSDSSVVPTKSSVFSSVPVLGQAASIKSASSTAAGSDINDSFNLYYGVKTSDTMASGVYKMIPDTNNGNNDGTIVYQATIADNCIRYTVAFNPTSTAGGNTLSGTGTMDDQIIYESAATPLTPNGFTAPSGYEFAGWNTAQDGTGTLYADGESVTDLVAVGNTITLYAQWEEPCPGGKICYKANGSNVAGTMGQQTIAGTDTSAVLLASNFSRSGYGFVGWSDVANYAADQNAHLYGPQENISFNAGQYSTRGLKLYAVWIASAGTMQSDTAAVCNSLTAATYDDDGDADESTWTITAGLSSVSALTDNRDGQTYAIAKLTDGNCWMIENLRLADTHQEGLGTFPTSLDTENTNNPLNGVTPVALLSLKHNYTDTTTYNTLSPTSSDATSWCQTNSAACFDQSRLRTDNTANRATNPTDGTGNMYSYGNYYNWYSATAGIGTYSVSSGSVDGDLCPAGWHLPSGHSDTTATVSGEFGVLSNSLGGYKNASGVAQKMTSSTTPTEAIMRQRLLHFPNNMVYAGYVSGASISIRGSGGSWWSSTAASSGLGYGVGVGTSGILPGTSSVAKYVGRSVRCIADGPTLYNEVAKLSKGTLVNNNVAITDTITTPTSTNKVTDTSNSGVYEYDAAAYGVASDAANTRKIYFYRGILETNPGTYGSSGSANAYPNYVKLDNNTCWRIVRTTGSGGVKMIYNGVYDTTNNTCANSQSGAQVTTQAFNQEGFNIARVGYTYNGSVSNSTSSVSVDTVFGNDSNPSLNNTRSAIKTYIEDTWYANNMTSYTSNLEASAGYCNDRTVYSSAQLNPTALTTVVPYAPYEYGIPNTEVSFGSEERIAVAGASPSLTCDRSTVDLYRYVANSTGVGNELKYPVALLTADEMALAGSGWTSTTTAYSAQSYLRSGSDYWSLSPRDRSTDGGVRVSSLYSNGSAGAYGVDAAKGVRPVISLIPGTEVAGGSGTATDPWTVSFP